MNTRTNEFHLKTNHEFHITNCMNWVAVRVSELILWGIKAVPCAIIFRLVGTSRTKRIQLFLIKLLLTKFLIHVLTSFLIKHLDLYTGGQTSPLFRTNLDTNGVAMPRYGLILSQNEAYSLYGPFGSLVCPISPYI